MFDWLLDRLYDAGRRSVIMDRENLKPYLVRYYVAWPDGDKRQRKDIPFNVFLHQFIQSDDPVLHTHPWWYCTIILKGGYWEHVPVKDGHGGYAHKTYLTSFRGHKEVLTERKWRGPGSIRFGRRVVHWVELPDGGAGKTWTLFIRGRTRNDGDWFFINEFGAEEFWSDYLKRHNKSTGQM